MVATQRVRRSRRRVEAPNTSLLRNHTTIIAWLPPTRSVSQSILLVPQTWLLVCYPIDLALSLGFFDYTSFLVSTRLHALAVACYCLHPTDNSNMLKASKPAFYAVAKGRVPGVYGTRGHLCSKIVPPHVHACQGRMSATGLWVHREQAPEIPNT